jgi:hypothetical protein
MHITESMRLYSVVTKMRSHFTSRFLALGAFVYWMGRRLQSYFTNLSHHQDASIPKTRMLIPVHPLFYHVAVQSQHRGRTMEFGGALTITVGTLAAKNDIADGVVDVLDLAEDVLGCAV